MAYVFYPPRTSNYFPPGMPYLAGLGDYAADLATYKHQQALYEAKYKKWLADKKKVDALIAGMNASYGLALANYARDKAAWDKEYDAYLAAVDTYNTQYAGIKRANTQRSQTLDASRHLNLPQSYYDAGACLTQAQHNAYAGQCTTVKGFLGLGSSDTDCGMAALPICNYPAKPAIRAQPQPPANPRYPTLRAAPVAPTAPAAPPGGGSGTQTPPSVPVQVSLPSPPGPEENLPAAAPKQANILMNGLIVVAVLGGGYLVYRTLRKPKAQAA